MRISETGAFPGFFAGNLSEFAVISVRTCVSVFQSDPCVFPEFFNQNLIRTTVWFG
jgi:hypothetical protein